MPATRKSQKQEEGFCSPVIEIIRKITKEWDLIKVFQRKIDLFCMPQPCRVKPSREVSYLRRHSLSTQEHFCFHLHRSKSVLLPPVLLPLEWFTKIRQHEQFWRLTCLKIVLETCRNRYLSLFLFKKNPETDRNMHEYSG